MDNFDDMYSDGPGASAPNLDSHGLKRKAALDFDTVPSTSTSSTSTAPFATAWAADVETGEMYNTAVKGAKISPMDIKRRAVLVRTSKCDKLFCSELGVLGCIRNTTILDYLLYLSSIR